MGTAIEAIYRDLDYARSLIKGTPSQPGARDDDDEHATIRERYSRTPEPRSEESSRSSPRGSPRGGPASDWSVISDSDDYQTSTS